MRIVDLALYPISVAVHFSKDLGSAVINRIALEIFVACHKLLQTEKSKEIEDISSAIEDLEKNQSAQDHLSRLATNQPPAQQLLPSQVGEQQLLLDLKTHRFTFSYLYHGLDANKQLSTKICTYVNTKGHVVPKKSPLRRLSSQLTPVKIPPNR